MKQFLLGLTMGLVLAGATVTGQFFEERGSGDLGWMLQNELLQERNDLLKQDAFRRSLRPLEPCP